MEFRNKKVAFGTLGCKLNFSETSTIARSFVEMGFTRVDFKEHADVYVINTCSVTDTADKKSRTMIRQVSRQNPAAFVVVIGCYAQLKPEEAASIPGVDLVLGANDKFNITKYLENLEKHQLSEVHSCSFKEITAFEPSASFGDRTRSFLKVQDGCNYFCTYCTIPLARGRSRNPSVASLIEQARQLTAQGIREINLTGVNIGDFGRSSGESFFELLQAFDKMQEDVRIRMGSVEPNLLTDDIISLVADSVRIAPHFHLPLQAGTNEVLELMKRKYNTELFQQRVDAIRKRLPYSFIGVDMIAGMSGETDELFEKAFRFVKNLEVSQFHAFPYSERANTRAIHLEGVVPPEVRKQRTKRLIALSEDKLEQFYKKNIGKDAVVLFENQRNKKVIHGWTENYIKVEASYQSELINQTRSVRLKKINDQGSVEVELLPI